MRNPAINHPMVNDGDGDVFTCWMLSQGGGQSAFRLQARLDLQAVIGKSHAGLYCSSNMWETLFGAKTISTREKLHLRQYWIVFSTFCDSRVLAPSWSGRSPTVSQLSQISPRTLLCAGFFTRSILFLFLAPQTLNEASMPQIFQQQQALGSALAGTLSSSSSESSDEGQPEPITQAGCWGGTLHTCFSLVGAEPVRPCLFL